MRRRQIHIGIMKLIITLMTMQVEHFGMTVTFSTINNYRERLIGTTVGIYFHI